MIAGFQDSAIEIRELVRDDIVTREAAKEKQGCSSRLIPLGKDIKKLSTLAEVFCELEQLALEGNANNFS